jgi:2-dehydro-3-deoxyphosphogluconate aldolase/(4S)-4-hydroxy-2-oxoglutarate aldolase
MDLDHVEAPGARLGIPAGVLAGRTIAIARGFDPGRLAAIGEGLASGGVGAFEVTLNSPGALDGIRLLASRFAPDKLLIGAGTVLSVASARAAIDAGARFVVMPHLDPEIVRTATALGVNSFPGVFTPSEALAAWRAGATAVKLFPASAVGPQFVREMRGPFPDVPIVPTGGVTLATGPDFIAAGAVAVGLGSWLTGSGEVDTIAERARQIVAALRAARP